METYTYKQILNERIREFQELKQRFEELQQYIEFSDNYEFLGASCLLNQKDSVDFRYKYVKVLDLCLSWLRSKLPRYYRPRMSVTFNTNQGIQERYTDKHRFGRTILEINDKEEFTEGLNDIFDSPLYNELYSRGNVKTSNSDSALEIAGNDVSIRTRNIEIQDSISTTLYSTFGNLLLYTKSDNPEEILKSLMNQEFPSSEFSEYFQGQIAEYSDCSGKDVLLDIEGMTSRNSWDRYYNFEFDPCITGDIVLKRKR